MAHHEFRSTGRTTRRAVQTLNLALASPGVWVNVIDHNDLETSHLSLANSVSSLLTTLSVAHEVDRTKIRVKPLRKYREK